MKNICGYDDHSQFKNTVIETPQKAISRYLVKKAADPVKQLSK